MCDDEWLQFCSNDSYHINNSEPEARTTETTHCPKAGELYISTKSKIGYLDQEIDLASVFWKIPVIPYYWNQEGVIKKQIKMTLETEDSINEELAKCKESEIDVEDISKKKDK